MKPFPQPISSQAQLVVFSLLFLFSGAAGLIYQIVWERLLEMYFGVTMTAVTLIVGAFMAGLGLGSLFGGRFAERSPRVLFAYGLAEIGIGLFGLISPALITGIGAATAGAAYGFVFILSFAILFIPTFLMGTTLPLLAQGFIRRVETSGQTIGILYGINTLGAALGALAAAYFLIGPLGFDGALGVAVAINLVIGVLSLALSKMQAPGRTERAETATPAAAPNQLGYRTILVAAFLVGFIGLGFEMLWVRALSIINKNTAYGFPSILAIFLIGLAIGSYLWGRRADTTRAPLTLLCNVELGVGLAAGLSFLVIYHGVQLEPIRAILSDVFWSSQHPSPYVETLNGLVYSRWQLLVGLLVYLVPILVMVFPTSLIMGGLPILDRLSISRVQNAGQRVGHVHLANILGSVLGTLVISFVFLPRLGSEQTLQVLIALTFIVPLLLFIDKTKFQLSATTIFLGALTAVVLMALPQKGEFYLRLYEAATGGAALVHEDASSVLALSVDQKTSAPTLLWIGGEINSTFPSIGGYERVNLTCAAANQPRRILVVGLGGGNTAFFLTHLPGVQEIVIVELMPGLNTFLAGRVPSTARALKDPRVKYSVDDARRFLYANPTEKYDLITIDPLHSYSAGHNNLYSIEALELYKNHLAVEGILCLWHDEGKIIPYTASVIFPYTDSFGGYTVASEGPIHYNVDYMAAAKQDYLLQNNLTNDVGLAGMLDLFSIMKGATQTRAQRARLEEGSVVLEDMHPWLEYYLFHNPPETLLGNFNARQDIVSRLEGCDATCIQLLGDR